MSMNEKNNPLIPQESATGQAAQQHSCKTTLNGTETKTTLNGIFISDASKFWCQKG